MQRGTEGLVVAHLCQSPASYMNASGLWTGSEWPRCRTVVLSILAAGGHLQELSKILIPAEGKGTVGQAMSLLKKSQVTLKGSLG